MRPKPIGAKLCGLFWIWQVVLVVVSDNMFVVVVSLLSCFGVIDMSLYCY